MATKKAAAKKKTARKTPAKKAPTTTTPAKKTAEAAGGKAPATQSPSRKSPAKKAPAKKVPAKKSAAKSSSANYTRPELREKIKQQVIAGDKGGRAGQWSARKAQLVAHEYEAEGGGYKEPRNPTQESLKHWGDEHWHTADGKQAIQGDTTHRYLPDEAWQKLSPAEKKATDRKKVVGSQHGKQFVANTPAAARARKAATKP